MLFCCLTCAQLDKCEAAIKVEDYCAGYVERPMTNADRIRAMTDEELARFITKEDLCELTCGSPIPCDGRCESMMLAWLKSPWR